MQADLTVDTIDISFPLLLNRSLVVGKCLNKPTIVDD
jgi:hypothetical protein